MSSRVRFRKEKSKRLLSLEQQFETYMVYSKYYEVLQQKTAIKDDRQHRKMQRKFSRSTAWRTYIV